MRACLRLVAQTSLRIGFCFAYVNLVLAYLGQGARMMSNGEEVISNLFYNTIPGPSNGGLFWVVWCGSLPFRFPAPTCFLTPGLRSSRGVGSSVSSQP